MKSTAVLQGPRDRRLRSLGLQIQATICSMPALPSIAEIYQGDGHVRFVPLPDIQEPGERGTGRAASSGGSSLGWRDERRRIHVPLFADARSIASNSVSLKRQPSASRLALA